MSEPPVARLRNEISNGPGFLIDKQTFDFTHATIGSLNVIPEKRIAAPKVRIAIVQTPLLRSLLPRSILLCQEIFGTGHVVASARQHRAGVEPKKN